MRLVFGSVVVVFTTSFLQDHVVKIGLCRTRMNHKGTGQTPFFLNHAYINLDKNKYLITYQNNLISKKKQPSVLNIVSPRAFALGNTMLSTSGWFWNFFN